MLQARSYLSWSWLPPSLARVSPSARAEPSACPASGVRRGRLACLRQPAAEALIDLGVVEKREVVGAPYVVPVLVAEGDPPGPAPPVALGFSTRMSPSRRPSGWLGSRVTVAETKKWVRPRQQRHLLAGHCAQRLGITPAPVLVDERSVAQVANAGTAPFQEAPQHPRLGELVERHRSQVRPLLQGSAQVGGPQRDDVP